MKILLAAVNAKYIHSNPAIYSLRAFAKDWQAYTEIAEYTINQLPEEILSDLYERKPDVIAFSCYIWNRSMIAYLLRELKKILPDVALWIGGPEVSYDAPIVLREFPELTGVMVGEGERTFADLCRYYAGGEGDLRSISGLCLPDTGMTPPRALTDLDDIPFFYDDLSVFDNRILYYETSRGCPYRCSYCLSSIDKTVRFRSLEKVFHELDFFLANNVMQVKFIDRTFNCDRERARSIWRYLKRNDNGITNFHFEIAADLLDDEDIALLQSLRAGQVQLEIGVQTTNIDTLSAIRRVMRVDHLRDTVARLRKNKNIHIHLDLIAGLPEEDLASFRKSFDDVYRMGCEDLQLGFLKVLKGSFMEANAEAYDLRYLSEPPYEVLSTQWLSYADLLELKRVERVLEIYHNTNQYRAMLGQLERETDSPYDLYLRLADFYRAQGCEQNRPSRMEKFRVLLDFAIARRPENAELYRELLTFDAYARDRCKRRPDFAADLIPYKEAIRRTDAKKEDHVDVFFYPVWQDDPRERRNEPYYVIFDYDHRDLLTNNAAIRVAEDQ